MKFTVGGHAIELDHDAVVAGLRGKVPPEHGRMKYFIAVGGKQWPVKAALCEATGLHPAQFITTEAVRVLTKVGFPITRRD